jgi:outer membrane protein assembly factor BamD
MAARDGEPTLTDPAATLAPHITTQIMTDFKDAMNPAAPTAAGTAPLAAKPATDTAAESAPATAPAAAPAAPLAFQDVPAAEGGSVSGSSAAVTNVQGNYAAPAASGNSIGGVEILSSGATVAPPADNGGLKAVGPENATPLPAAEKPAVSPDAVNDIAPGTQPAAQASNGKKNGKPEFDKSDESDSKHKKKKGLAKLNPF